MGDAWRRSEFFREPSTLGLPESEVKCSRYDSLLDIDDYILYSMSQ